MTQFSNNDKIHGSRDFINQFGIMTQFSKKYAVQGCKFKFDTGITPVQVSLFLLKIVAEVLNVNHLRCGSQFPM